MDIGMNELLQLAVDEKASDLHLNVGVPPVLRICSRLHPIEGSPLTAADTERLMKSITSPELQQKVLEQGGVDFGFSFADKARFRVSVLRAKGQVGIVLRQIPSRMMSLEEIGLPPQIKELLYRPRGLVLVTGPTGQGKSTTLASMINVINQERDCHIITIEDPIEYYHHHKKSLITQREIGVDVPNFKEALKRALRQDPDVVLVGEMRDLETMEAAIAAAETGHMVFATLHTTGAARTVDRIVDAFPTNQQQQIRTQLSVTVVAVISQLLLVRADAPGMVAAFEIMISTPAIQSLIRDNKTFRITSEIQTGTKHGMITLDAHMMALYQAGQIRYEDLITKAQDQESIVNTLRETAGAVRKK